MPSTRAKCSSAVDKIKLMLEIVATTKMTHSCRTDPAPKGNSVSDVRVQPANEESLKVVSDNVCTICFKTDSKDALFKLCSGCQGKMYCSKECQARDWPEHKSRCGQNDRRKRHKKLVYTLLSNTDLRIFLQVAIILSLDLLHKNWDEHFYVMVGLGVEPRNILDFARLRGDLEATNAAVEKKMKGMIQINGVFGPPWPLLDERERRLTLEIPKQEREQIRALVLPKTPVGLVNFSMGDTGEAKEEAHLNFVNVVRIPTVLDPLAILIAHKAPPFTRTVLATGTSRPVPMTVASCLEYINTTIRLDKDNLLSLHADVKPEDKRLIRASAAPIRDDKDSLDLGFLRLKIENENVYKVLGGLTDILL
ncbi:hypothetical protein BDN70DRAFT_708608 [Pholiota conissans]|uniref:MYND-type domain-containing protein n=1 Tax=Pholiota conissans TaxID=109636 RepID=A0A9P5ZBP1_9AGAR|nr:hypothetical protein BDN70DRAFT_708608 [Pholiota conissans]